MNTSDGVMVGEVILQLLLLRLLLYDEDGILKAKMPMAAQNCCSVIILENIFLSHLILYPKPHFSIMYECVFRVFYSHMYIVTVSVPEMI